MSNCLKGLLLAVFAAGSSLAAPARPDATNCNESAGPIVYVDVPGHPFGAVPTADGCWIFVSMPPVERGSRGGIGVLRRTGGKASLMRFLDDDDAPLGMALTHDGKLLIVANNTNVVFLDVESAVSGNGNPVAGTISEPGRANPSSVYVNVTKDDRFLFVSDEGASSIAVIDLDKARLAKFADGAIIGKIPVGNAPIALTFSPDERYLYSTSEIVPGSFGWRLACKPEGEDPATAKIERPEGAVMVIDVEKAKRDPVHSVVAAAPAGCSPVRLQLSPAGDRAYVSVRNSNALLVFDTAKLRSDPVQARIATVPVGTAPVGVAVSADGGRVFVTNSNRFFAGSSDSQTLTVIDATKVSAGAAAILGSVPAGGFPRELKLTNDGRTLLVTNFNSKSLELLDLARLPLQQQTH
jgi:DNA-binding beta-propeller fold protein YncE